MAIGMRAWVVMFVRKVPCFLSCLPHPCLAIENKNKNRKIFSICDKMKHFYIDSSISLLLMIPNAGQEVLFVKLELLKDIKFWN